MFPVPVQWSAKVLTLSSVIPVTCPQQTVPDIMASLGETDGEIEREMDGLILGDSEGEILGLMDGLMETDMLGLIDGDIEGDIDKLTDGDFDRDRLGDIEGDADDVLPPPKSSILKPDDKYAPNLPPVNDASLVSRADTVSHDPPDGL